LEAKALAIRAVKFQAFWLEVLQEIILACLNDASTFPWRRRLDKMIMWNTCGNALGGSIGYRYNSPGRRSPELIANSLDVKGSETTP
jgi:hypothetical protein